MNNNIQEDILENTPVDNAAAQPTRKGGRQRRFGAEFPNLPFKEYEKLYQNKYMAIRREAKQLEYGPKKKIGRQRKHFAEELGITKQEDGSFHCNYCNHCFHHKPERHVKGVRCKRAREVALQSSS